MKWKENIWEIVQLLLLLIIALICARFLTSCTPQYQANRLLKKHPEIFKTDTIIVHDTIVTERAGFDTVFVPVKRDTTILVKDKLTIKYYPYPDSDTIYIDGECESDTIYREKPIYLKTPQYIPTTWGLFKQFWMPVLIIAVMLGIIIALIFKSS